MASENYEINSSNRKTSENYEMNSSNRKTPDTYEEIEHGAGQLAMQMGYSQQLQEKFGLVSMVGFSCEFVSNMLSGLPAFMMPADMNVSW